MKAISRCLLSLGFVLAIIGAQGFMVFSAPASGSDWMEEDNRSDTPAFGSRISAVHFLAHKAHTESSVVTYSIPSSPVSKRKAEGYNSALNGEAAMVTTRLKRGLTRYMAVKQGFDVPDLIFPFHYFP